MVTPSQIARLDQVKSICRDIAQRNNDVDLVVVTDDSPSDMASTTGDAASGRLCTVFGHILHDVGDIFNGFSQCTKVSFKRFKIRFDGRLMSPPSVCAQPTITRDDSQ